MRNSSVDTATMPPVLRVEEARARIHAHRQSAGEVLVVLDDDPTGTQVVHDLDVYLSWSEESLHKAMTHGDGTLFLSTNSRSLSGASARALVFETVSLLHATARQSGRRLQVASRSDSTLRGHYMEETHAVTAAMGMKPDGILVAPAFFEGGRYTLGDTQWVRQGDTFTPAHLTEFAQDPVFGFRTAYLPEWISEKTHGLVRRPEDVLSISVQDVREGGPRAVREKFMKVERGRPVVVNAMCYEDLEVVVLGLQEAEEAGKQFIYRCAASFVKVRAGLDDKPLLTASEMKLEGRSGPVVVGSFAAKTSRQLDALFSCKGTVGIEMRVAPLLASSQHDDEVRRVGGEIRNVLDAGRTPVLYTSRERWPGQGEAFLSAGTTIMDALCTVVRELERPLAYVIAKGGITSHALARDGLGIRSARVLGQIAAGVAVWRLGPESRHPGSVLVVFPGNVGEDGTLADVWRTLSERENA